MQVRFKQLLAVRHPGLGLAICLGLLLTRPEALALTLEEAIGLAQHNDPWLTGSEFRQQALEAESMVAGTLPDPVVSVGLANLPTDSFDFDQEAMTQFKVGVSQVFPRGDSRELNRRRLTLLGEQFPYQRDERRARVAVRVAHLWLEAFRAQETIRLIEQDRALFEDLVDVAQSSYASALGRTRQQDLVRAQLELTRLEDRLAALHERRDMSWSRLGEWLAAGADRVQPLPGEQQLPSVVGPGSLPELALQQPQWFVGRAGPSPQQIAATLKNHPAVLSLDRSIDASETDVALAEQKYRPQWKVNASYGYREDDPMGNDRADFFSVGVAFDLPLFTSRRQDKQVQSATAGVEVRRTEKILLLRNMIADFEAQRARLFRINQRRDLYGSRLLQEMQEQAEASLTAYTHDDGDFSEVVRARIAELNARIEALDIEVDRLKTISQINYFFATSSRAVEGEAS